MQTLNLELPGRKILTLTTELSGDVTGVITFRNDYDGHIERGRKVWEHTPVQFTIPKNRCLILSEFFFNAQT